MLNQVKSYIAEALSGATGLSEEQALATLEVQSKEGFGDMSSKIAFMLAAERKQNPAKIAADIVATLVKFGSGFVERVEAKGPYINFYLSNAFYAEAVKKILKEKEKFGSRKKTKETSKKIVVEYFHANTHKGVHIGHIRNISLGESLCRILEFEGDKVIRANYQGDIGPHVAKCLWGFLNLYNGKKPEGEKNLAIWLGKVYTDASQRIKENATLEAQVQEINLKLYSGDKKMSELWKKTRQWCLDGFEEFYKEFGVKFDQFYFESETQEIGKKLVKDLLKKNIVREDQGAIIMDLKDQELGVLVLLTKEGYPLYSTKDLGLAKLKFEKYNPDKSIHVVGKEQEFYFKQLFATFKRIGKDFENAATVSHHLIYELVMLPEGKMSSREGTMVLYEDLKQKLMEITVAEVKKRHPGWKDKDVEKTALQIALAAIKFSMLRRESNKVLLFNWNEALALEGDTGPYLQYAYVRTNGIMNKAKIEKKAKASVEKSHIFNPDEKALIKKLCGFPGLLENSAKDMAPNQVIDYLLELGADFNKFYATSPVLTAEKESEIQTRLAIVNASGLILKSGLDLLGIECPERM